MLFEEGFTQNRELSWLRYNERVLEEALDETVPLLERLRFIGIFVSNLEEFFRVRVGSLLGEEDEGDDEIDEKSGMTAAEQLRRIHSMVPGLLMKKDMAYGIVEGELAEAGIRRMEPYMLREQERGMCFDFFREHIKDRIKISVLDADESLPHVDENRPYMIAELDAELEDKFGFIDMPGDLPKLFVLPELGLRGSAGEQGYRGRHSKKQDEDAPRAFRYVLTEDIIKMFSDMLFIPFIPVDVHVIDIARNAEAAGRAGSAKEMREVVRRRKTAPADKLISDSKLSKNLEDYFARNLDLDRRQMFTTTRIDFSYIDELEAKIPAGMREDLVYEPHVPHDQAEELGGDMITAALERDILSAYPYDSMDAFLSLLREASFSPLVKEIRLTIYRLASHPKIADYLIYAARNGKKVRVVLELRARFDEEKNLAWAEKLSAAGCRVSYGTDKYKVHSKMCQIVLFDSSKKDAKGGSSDRKRYITQISTGNYNEKTAALYTDLSLITSDRKIGKAVSRLFKDICREEIEEEGYEPLLVSPVDMRQKLLKLIKRETKKGADGRIFFKINSLTDEEMIEALMEASCAGCSVRLIVRGICCMLPGIEGCTENVCIVNRVGRFLEHSRVYIFGEGNEEKMYLSSADLMTRNLDKRVEAACPVTDRKIKDRIRGLMIECWCDADKGRVLLPDGSYARK